MEKEIINYEPINLDSRAYRFFPTGILIFKIEK